jgi:hypothetical protein
VKLNKCFNPLLVSDISPCKLFSVCTICHNPTNNPKQLKTTFVGVVILSVRKTTTPPRLITIYFTSRQPRKLIFGMQSYSNPTRRNIADHLNIFENGRQPQIYFKRKMTSIFWKIENGLNKSNATKNN